MLAILHADGLDNLLTLLYACTAEAPPENLPALPPIVGDEGGKPPGEARPLREFVVAFTGEVRGEIEPCGCPTVPYGGFRRRARLLEELRAENFPVFVLDAGEMLVKGLAPEAAADRVLRANTVLALARATGLDAWTASGVDLAPGGLDLLVREGALAANWRSEPALPASRIVERGGVRLGVIGLAGSAGKDVRRVDAVEAVSAARTGEADAWVVLSSADYGTNRAVAEGVPGIGAVLSISGDALEEPVTTSGAPIVETADRGRFVSVLRVAVGTDPGPWELGNAALEKAGGARRRAATAEAGASLAATVAEANATVVQAAAGRNLAVLDAYPLGSDLDVEGAADALIAEYGTSARAAASARVASTPPGVRYGTTTACAGCHSDRVAAWAFDDHARAVESLASRGETTNVECIGCHTTGYGQLGGWADTTPANLRTWKAVQCESCHGPMGGHPDDARVVPRKVTEATCLRCHDEANSPEFSYESWITRISCSRMGG